MKLCRTCRRIKKISDFYKHLASKDGMCGECKECKRIRSNTYNKQHRVQTRKISKRFRKNHKKKCLLWLKRAWDKRIFNGMRVIILKRDRYKCVKCGITQKEHIKKWGVDINIDHKNRNRKDNALDNLQTICCHCHGKKDNRSVSKSENVVTTALKLEGLK